MNPIRPNILSDCKFERDSSRFGHVDVYIQLQIILEPAMAEALSVAMNPLPTVDFVGTLMKPLICERKENV